MVKLMIKRIIQWFNKPLPKVVCQVIKGCDRCKVDWIAVLFFATIVIIIIYVVPFIASLF